MSTLTGILWVAALIGGPLLLCAVLMRIEKRRRERSYDERQQIARGKAMRAAFFTGMFYYLTIAVWSLFGGEIRVELHLLLGGGLILQFLVLHTYCVFADAHLTLHERPIPVAIVYFVIGVLQLASFWSLQRWEKLSLVGEGAKIWWNLIVGISFIYIGALHLISHILRSRE